jgi:hypothetical protein
MNIIIKFKNGNVIGQECEKFVLDKVSIKFWYTNSRKEFESNEYKLELIENLWINEINYL